MQWLRGPSIPCAVLLLACGSERVETPLPDEAPPACVAGVGQTPVDGCGAGIPPDSCGAGFEADGAMGCAAILPDAPCADGMMALPGETTCRELIACGSGTWGDIVSDSTTQFVDESYILGDSDGTESKPWPTIAEAIAAAADGAVVAIAEGIYSEDLRADKRIELWGRCPSRVELRASGVALQALQLDPGASGSVVRNLAISGAAGGIGINGASDVTIEGVWVHDTTTSGVVLQPDLSSSVAIVGSLLERVGEVGIHVVGANADITSSVVRGTLEASAYATGYAIVAQRSMGGSPSVANVSGALLQGNHTASLLVVGSTAAMEDSVVQDTLPSTLSSRDGVGILAQDSDGAGANLTVLTSVVANNSARGIAVVGSQCHIEHTLVRDTQPQPWDDGAGEGIAVLNSGAVEASADIIRSTIANSYESGISLRGSNGVIQWTLVRATQPRRKDDDFGRGIAVVGDAVERLQAQADIDSCLVDDSFAFGIYVADATAAISSTQVMGTKPQLSDSRFGDGITLATKDAGVGAAHADIVHTRSEGNAGAGFALLAATMTLEGSSMECNEIDLLASDDSGSATRPALVEDRGDNSCGCKGNRRECSVTGP